MTGYGKLLSLPSLQGDGWLRWKCPGCGEDMQQPAATPAWGQGVGRPCEKCERLAQPQLDRAEALRAAGCPSRYLQPFVAPDQWPIGRGSRQMSLDEWIGDPWAVVLAGAVEGGKTMLATELLWRLISRGMSGLWCRADEVIDSLYGTHGEERRALAKKYTTVPALLLDELGGGHNGETWETLLSVLGPRFDALRPTIVTTNRPLVSAGREKGADSARPRSGDDKPGLAQEHPAIYRRLVTDGLAAGFKTAWRRRNE